MIDSSRMIDRIERRQARGFTLIELMISVTIAVFLIGGALAIVGRTRSTFAAQNQLAQLQDNERLALTFMAEVIESGGYFPLPQTYQASTVMPVVASTFATAGQAIFGTYSATVPGDQVYVRFGTRPGDIVYGCTGVSNIAVSPYDTYTNFFWVKNTATTLPLTNANAQLMCTFTNAAGTQAAVPLVNGVTNLVVLYGLKKNATNTGSCTDTYLTATQVNASPPDWLKVCSIKVKITFANPITTGTTPGQPITIERVMAVMTAVGVNS
jgi:type IV pilus assembly protein PilW